MKNFYLIGKDIEYSLSSEIYNYLFSLYNINAKYKISSLSELEPIISNFKKSNGFNITIPYKEKIIPYLTENKSKGNLKVINTVLVKNEKFIGYNTDLLAFELLVKEKKLNFQKIAILGSGGTSKMLKYYFENIYKKKEDVRVYTFSRAKENALENVYTYDKFSDFSFDTIINTTPCGQGKFSDKLPIDKVYLKSKYLKNVIDFNYAPFNNKFILESKKNGIKTLNGLELLINQAAFNFKIWTDINIDKFQRQKLKYFLELKRTKGILVYGLPLAGKTTIFKKFENRFGGPKKIFDLDQEISKNYNIDKYIKNCGIEEFRKLEKKTFSNIDTMDFKIIFLGGGTLENLQFFDGLQDYKLVYLKLESSELEKRLTIHEINKRPLLNNKDDLHKIIKKREVKYNSIADEIFYTSKELEEYLSEMYDN